MPIIGSVSPQSVRASSLTRQAYAPKAKTVQPTSPTVANQGNPLVASSPGAQAASRPTLAAPTQPTSSGSSAGGGWTPWAAPIGAPTTTIAKPTPTPGQTPAVKPPPPPSTGINVTGDRREEGTDGVYTPPPSPTLPGVGDVGAPQAPTTMMPPPALEPGSQTPTLPGGAVGTPPTPPVAPPASGGVTDYGLFSWTPGMGSYTSQAPGVTIGPGGVVAWDGTGNPALPWPGQTREQYEEAQRGVQAAAGFSDGGASQGYSGFAWDPNLGPDQRTTEERGGDANLGTAVNDAAAAIGGGIQEAVEDIPSDLGTVAGEAVSDFRDAYNDAAGQPPSMMDSVNDIIAQLGGMPGQNPLLGAVGQNWMSAMDAGAWEQMARNRLDAAREANLGQTNDAMRRLNDRAARTGFANPGGVAASIFSDAAARDVQSERDIFNDALMNQMNALQGASSFGLGAQSADLDRFRAGLAPLLMGAQADYDRELADNPAWSTVLRDIMGAGGQAAGAVGNNIASMLPLLLLGV